HALRDLVGRGCEVHATHLEPDPPLALDGVHWHRVDLMNGDAVSGLLDAVRPEGLLHLAWYAVHGKFWRAPENLPWTAASINIVRAFREAGGTRVTAAGTCAEYDWSGDGLMNEATTPLRPSTLYGTCKDAFRRVLEAYAAETKLSWSWGRIFFLYGPGEHPARFVANVAGALARGETARMTHGRQVRDFLHVEDVARALVALLLSEVEGAVNIASGEAVSLGDVAEELERASGRGHLERGAIQAPDGEPQRIVAEVARLRDEVGYRPTRTLSDGLAEMVRGS
ncbi:MAG TPA: NAD(P)-dependent oxidoreductase, partial [Polyangiaceae bacterium]